MKNQYWHFGYVFVIGASSFFAFRWYQEVKALERDLVDATETMGVMNKFFLSHDTRQVSNEITEAIHKQPKYMEWAVKANASETETDSLMAFLHRTEKAEKIDWMQVTQRYNILIDSLMSRTSKSEQPWFAKKLQQSINSLPKANDLSHLSLISQHYWLAKHKVSAKKSSLLFLNHALDHFSPPEWLESEYLVVISPRKCATTKLGEELELDITILNQGSYRSGDTKEILIIQDKQISLPKYQHTYRYKERVTKLGMQRLEIVASIANLVNGERYTAKQEWKYEGIP
jgi:hypothetical protein